MCEIAGIKFANNVWNAPVPLTQKNIQDILYSDAGALVYKTCTLHPKAGNPTDFSLNENGSTNNVALHNDGIDVLIEDIFHTELNKPFFVSVFGTEEELLQIIFKLNDLDSQFLIEWNISCPNVQANDNSMTNCLRRRYGYPITYSKLKIVSKNPIGIKVGYRQFANSDVEFLNKVDFITAINSIEGKAGKYIHEQALDYVAFLSSISTVPIIAVGGAETEDDVQEFLNRGATAVEIGTGFLKHGVNVFSMKNSRKYLSNCIIENKIFVKNTQFALKSGMKSNVYLDFRDAFSLPELWMNIISESIRVIPLNFDFMCGVPQGAIPLASCMSFSMGKPMIFVRKEIKNHGMGKKIEGRFKEGEKCLIIEDVITTGKSVEEIIRELQPKGIIISGIFTLVNRSNKKKILGMPVYSLFHLNHLIHRHIQVPYSETFVNLKRVILRKNTRLCFSADLQNSEKILDLLNCIGKYICMLKLHLDIIEYDSNFLKELAFLREKHDFMVLIDRKFADISNTALLQFENVSKIIKPDFVTVHVNAGEEMVKNLSKKVGIFIVSQMSSNLENNPIHAYKAVEFALNYGCGIVTQKNMGKDLIHLVPGIGREKKDALDQKYKTRREEVNFADVIVVGRGIYEAINPIDEARYFSEW